MSLKPNVAYRALNFCARYEEALAHEGIATVREETDPGRAADHRATGQAVLKELPIRAG